MINIVAGIIIDTFGSLREELAKLNEDIYKIAGAAQSNQLIGSVLSDKISNQKLLQSPR